MQTNQNVEDAAAAAGRITAPLTWTPARSPDRRSDCDVSVRVDRAAQPEMKATEPRPTIFIVDDEYFVRSGIRAALEAVDWTVRDFEACEPFLSAYRPTPRSCLVLDAHMPRMDGLELVHRLRRASDQVPVVMISGSSDIAGAVAAMKAGVDEFFEKPVDTDALLAGVGRALRRAHGRRESGTEGRLAACSLSQLTQRQLQVMELVVAGRPSKIIAADLGVSQRTVETHRAAIMKKTGATSIPALARLAVSAASAASAAAAENDSVLGEQARLAPLSPPSAVVGNFRS